MPDAVINQILVATDFEPPARAALDWAVGLARPLHAEVLIAHVFDLPLLGLPDAAMVDSVASARMSEEAQESLDAELTRVSGRQVVVHGMVRQGDPVVMLPLLAEAEGVGLVVVGSHGRSGFARARLGSVADGMARRSRVPVVIVPVRPATPPPGPAGV